MENSKIEWTDHTANLWWGCMKVNAGCDNCYAESLDGRYNANQPHWGPHSNRKIVNGVWKDLGKFQRDAAAENTIKRVFVGSMMDIFEKPYPVEDSKFNLIEGINTGNLRDRFFQDVVPNSPNLLFLLLTKRPGNINKYIPESWKTNPPDNVMFGTSVVDQETANQLVPQLLQVNGKRFLSCEPLIGRVDLTEFIMLTDSNDSSKDEYEKRGWGYNNWSGGFESLNDTNDSVYNPKSGIDWIIVGGESGNNKNLRPMHPDWALSLKNQCKAANVPFFFKQWGNWRPGKTYDFYPENKPLMCIKSDGSVSWFAGDNDTTINHSTNYESDDCPVENVGKSAAGSLLDGIAYKEFPILTNA